MAVVDAGLEIHRATARVQNALSFLRQYLEAPMHGQVPDWNHLADERRQLDLAIEAFDALLQDGMNQEWPKPEPTPG